MSFKGRNNLLWAMFYYFRLTPVSSTQQLNLIETKSFQKFWSILQWCGSFHSLVIMSNDNIFILQWVYFRFLLKFHSIFIHSMRCTNWATNFLMSSSSCCSSAHLTILLPLRTTDLTNSESTWRSTRNRLYFLASIKDITTACRSALLDQELSCKKKGRLKEEEDQQFIFNTTLYFKTRRMRTRR